MTTRSSLAPVLSVLLFACSGGEDPVDDNGQQDKKNEAPVAVITSHGPGDTVLDGEVERFEGTVSDPDDPLESLRVTWFRNDAVACAEAAPSEDGATSCDIAVAPDLDEVRLEVIDPQGASHSDSVTLLVVELHAPEVVLHAPSSEGRYYAGLPVAFEATATDHEDPPEALVVSWTSSVEGALDLPSVPEPDGSLAGSVVLGEGTHLLTVQVEDTSGLTGDDEVEIVVGPPNTPPGCLWLAPETGSAGAPGAEVTVMAEVWDFDQPAEELLVTLHSDLDGALAEVTPTATGVVMLSTSGLSVGTHVLSMEVTDELGATCVDGALYTVGSPPEAIIFDPNFGTIFNEGEPVTFTGLVADPEWAADQLLVTWTSDLDGLLHDAPADVAGNTTFTTNTLSVGMHVVTLRVEDPTGLYQQRQVTVRVNGLPTAPVIALEPSTPRTADDLVADMVTASTDVDGDELVYSWQWWRDGTPTEHDGPVVPAGDTARGQLWEVEVVAFDGHGYGPAGADSAMVVNTPPEVDTLGISPDPARTTDLLTCTATGSDDDGDEVGFDYAWTVDGSAVGTGATLAPGAFSKGQVVRCTATPSDFLESGPSAWVELQVDNSPPVLTSVWITPSSPTTTDDLTCHASATDADGDEVTLTYAWTVDEIAAGTGEVLSSSAFAKGQDVRCTVTPHDDEGAGEADHAEVAVRNTPPVLTSVQITPDPATTTDELTCHASATDADDDPISFTWLWTVDEEEAGVEQTLDASAFSKGQDVRCTVTPHDDEGAGEADSAEIVIRNTPPVTTSVTISPPVAYTTTELSCSAGGTDADGDDIDFTYHWTVGAGTWTGETLAPSAFSKGQVVQCTATPHDGEDEGTPLATTREISNSPPTQPFVLIEPDEPVAGTDELYCFIEAASTDADGDPISYEFDWRVDGAPFTEADSTWYAGDTVPTWATSPGQEWICTVTPYDGEDWGPSDSDKVEVVAPSEEVYLIDMTQLIGMSSECCGETAPWGRVDQGFWWNDRQSVMPSSITIEYIYGISCTGVSLRDGYINTTWVGSVQARGDVECICCPSNNVYRSHTFEVPATYEPGGENRFLMSQTGNDEGLVANPDWGGFFARVTVSY